MVRDDIRAQHDLMKDKSFKDKLKYYWYYYKNKVVVTLILAIFIICLITSLFESSKDKSIFVILINSNLKDSSDTSLINNFVLSHNINQKAHPAVLDVSLQIQKDLSDSFSKNNEEKLWFYLQEDYADVVMGNDWLLNTYADMKPFLDLSDSLPTDLYALYHDNLYYHEYEEYGNIPIAINISNCTKLKSSGIYNDSDTLFFAIPVTSKRIDTAIDFLKYLSE